MRPRFRIALLVGGSVLATLAAVLVVFNYYMNKQIEERAVDNIESMTVLSYEDHPTMYSATAYNINGDYRDDNLQDRNVYTPTERALLGWCRENDASVPVKAVIGSKTFFVKLKKMDDEEYDWSFGTPEQYEDNMNFLNNIGLYDDSSYSFDDSSQSGDDLDYLDSLYETMLDDSEYIEQEEAYSDYIDWENWNKNDQDYDYYHSYYMPNAEKEGYMLIYVDISGEPEIIRKTTVFMLIAAVITGIFASLEGFIIGRKLEQSQLAQKQFFENTSHELKTPLTSIRGYAEGIETGIITDYRRTGRVISAQTEKMSRLIEEILFTAKLESGSLKLEKEYIEMSEFVENCLMPFEGVIMNKGIQVSLQLGEGKVLADPDRLDHAVSNLITNALKYAKHNIGLAFDGRVLYIYNDCEEIPPDDMKHIFERFHTGKNGNTGIGLAIAKEIIELHGWKIDAEYKNGGITFSIVISG